MFLFSSREDQQEVQRLLRRVSDLTVPNQTPIEGEVRAEQRSNRSLPVLLAPWEDEAVVIDECATAVTKDISGSGISLILRQPFRGDQVVVGLWLSTPYHPAADFEPLFFLGEVRQNVEIGGGFWQIGLQLHSRLKGRHADQIRRLAPLAGRLIPRHRQELAKLHIGDY